MCYDEIMDDTAQAQDQNSKIKNQNQTQIGGSMPQDQAQAQTQPQYQEPQAPVSAPQKEMGPVGTAEAYIAPSPSESMPTISPEVSMHAEAVENPETPKLNTEHKQAGIEAAKESTPVSTTPTGTIQLPMNEAEALKTIKTTSYSDSKHWLALLIEKIYQKLRGK